MAKVWKSQELETLEYWINTILEESYDKLTNWEKQFIESIDEQLASKRYLSQKQQETLERIYAEKTS